MGNQNNRASASEDVYWRVLLRRDPASVCRSTLAAFDHQKAAYMLRVVDLNYAIATKTRTIFSVAASGRDSGNVGWDIRLLILAYLAGATETSVTGRWVSPMGFSGGDLFFSSDAHNLRFTELLRTFESPENFLRAGQKVGGKRDAIGDSSFVLQTLPRIPMLFIYWVGDDELPSKISLLVDESAVSHLAIDGLWLAIRVSENRLIAAVSSEW